MRTEVKVGIVVGLIIVAGGLIFAFNQGQPAEDQTAGALPFDTPAKRLDADSKEKEPDPVIAKRPSVERDTTKRRPTVRRRTPTRRPTDIRERSTDRSPTAGRQAAPRGGAPKDPADAETPIDRGSRLPTPRVSTPPDPNTPTGRDEPAATQPSGPDVRRRRLPPRVRRPEPKDETPTDTKPAPRRAEPVVTPRDKTDSPSAGATVRRTPITRRPRVSPSVKHTVAEGDSLWYIAERYYGDGLLWKKILDANPGLNAGRLAVGQQIVIPPKDGPAKPDAPADKPASTPPDGSDKPVAGKHIYVVERGDSLITIARAYYKDGSRWRDIYELNKNKIANPDVLQVGLELKMPEK